MELVVLVGTFFTFPVVALTSNVLRLASRQVTSFLR